MSNSSSTSFRSRHLFNSETLGERLKSVREHWGWSLAFVSGRLQLDERYIRAIEGSNYTDIPGDIYAKHMLERYARLLNVNVDQVFSLYHNERKVLKRLRDAVIAPVTSRMPKVFITPLRLRVGFIASILLGIIGYLGVELYGMMRPPELLVFSPVSDTVTSSSLVVVEGKTETGAQVLINGEEVVGTQAGSFSEEVTLQPGVNVIEITAQKKRGKPTIVYQRVRVEDTTSPDTFGLAPEDMASEQSGV